ncbi:MAG: ABC transporter permease [Candidatus Omnitrophota bacterium]
MNLNRTAAVAKKEFIQIMRDPRSLALAFAIPVLLIFLFGYGLTLDVDNVPLAIWNQDNSQTSRDFILNFNNSRYFNIVGYYDNYRDMEYLLDRDKILMFMVIPKDFSKNIQSKREAPLQIVLDGSDSNTARFAQGYAESVVLGYNNNFETKAITEASIMNPAPVDLRDRTWFNPNRESNYFIIPGNIAVIIMIISSLLTSLTVAKEWERGTMEQLISTPVRGPELIAGKLIPYFIIGLIDLAIAVSMGFFIFHVPLRGNVILLFVLSGIFLVGALSLGLFISIFAKNQRLASQIAIMATFLPTYLLSGFMFAIFNMPKIIQSFTFLIPARYYMVILRGIYLKGIGARALWPQIIFLSLFAIFMVIVANRAFKKKVAEGNA